VTPTDLDAIRARDDSSQNDFGEWNNGEWNHDEDRYSLDADRRALRILVDQLLEREREARELLTVPICAWPECPDCRKIKAWLAAPSPVSPPKGPVTP
jgi:hypothetical protein